jgi:hypothetical protein
LEKPLIFRNCWNNGITALRLQSGFSGPKGEDYSGPVFTFATASTFITRAERDAIAPWTGTHDEMADLIQAGRIQLVRCYGFYVPFSNQLETGIHGADIASKELKWQEGATREDFYHLFGISVPTKEQVFA